MGRLSNKMLLLNHELSNIDLDMAMLEDKIEDIAQSGYNRYMKDISNSSYSLEYLMDKKIRLQQQRNNILYKIKALTKCKN